MEFVTKLIDWLGAQRDDRAKHHIAGNWSGKAGGLAVFALVYCMSWLPLPAALLMASPACLIAARVVAQWKEDRDREANEAAAEVGQDAPHEVSRGDIDATTAGAVPEALSFIVLALIVYFGRG
jgi:hypothetical protein